jgi:phosphoserine phosphatase
MSNPRDPDMLMRVLEVSRQLAAPQPLAGLLQQIVEAGREVLDADRGSILLYDRDTDELFAHVATGEETIRFPADRGLAGECAQSRHVINIPDCYADERFNPEIDRRTGYKTKCLISVPLIGLEDELEGVMQLLNAERGWFDEADEQLAVVLASQAAAALQRARLIADREARLKLERDLAIARDVQQRILPTTLPCVPGYDMAARSEPAEETGGDVYDALKRDRSADEKDDGALLILADASGHGIGPALCVSQFRAMLRMALRAADAELAEIAERMNAQLLADLDGRRFVTALLAELDPAGHALRYHAFGQGPLLHVAADGTPSWRRASSVPLGLTESPPMDTPDPLPMAPGDVAALLTDGFYEARDGQDHLLGPDRVADTVRRHQGESAQAILEALYADVERFTGGAERTDDVTGIVVKRENGSASRSRGEAATERCGFAV